MAGQTTPRKNSAADTVAAIAGLHEKVDSLADSVTKLAQVVADDRKSGIENTRLIYGDLKTMADKQATQGRITWPVIVSTVSAMFGLATLLAGLGTYALRSESMVLASKIDGANAPLALRAEMNALRNDKQDATLEKMRDELTTARIQIAADAARREPRPVSP